MRLEKWARGSLTNQKVSVMSNRILFNLFTTPPHECSYLPEQLATTLFMDPCAPKNTVLFNNLSQQGFRRSGEHIYRPNCQACQACIPVRIPVRKFTPRRSQRRVWQKNQDLTVSIAAPVFNPEHFDLYYRYLTSRHKDDSVNSKTPKGYMEFLTCSWAKTVFYEFRFNKQLLAIAVVDYLNNGLSAMYTFFDPEHAARSLGVYAILWEIEETKRLNFNYLYLGYWVKECRKMSYKTEYQLLEYFYQEKWQSALKK